MIKSEPDDLRGPLILFGKNGKEVIDFETDPARLYIWDFDGTLVPKQCTVFPSEILKGFVPDYKRFGMIELPGGWIEKLNEMGVDVSNPEVVAIISMRMDNWEAGGSNSRALFNWVRIVIPGLTKRKKLQAICTSNSTFNVATALNGLFNNFGTIRSCDHFGVRQKPHPDAIWSICAELGIDLADALMIGDGEEDGESARRAGSRFLLVKGRELHLKSAA